MQFNQAKYVASYFNADDIPGTGYPEIAFAGRSNVGKSTLINKILNRRKIAQVSKTPGKTKALNYFEINGKYYFVDLPGYGFARVPKPEREAWGKLIEGYLRDSKALRGLVHIIDCRRGVMETDWTLIEYISYIHNELEKDIGVIYVLSKADKLKSKARTEIYKNVLNELQCDPRQLIFSSATSGQGIPEIRKLVAEMLSR